MAIYIKVHQKTHRVELLLEFLVGIVDAELLKAVHLKRLKPDEKPQTPSYPGQQNKQQQVKQVVRRRASYP